MVGHPGQDPGRRDCCSTSLRIGQDTSHEFLGEQGSMAVIYDIGEYQEGDSEAEFDACLGPSCPPPGPTKKPREW